MTRDPVKEGVIKQTFREIISWLAYRINQKGDGVFYSHHEALGVVAEEYDELKDAIRSNDVSKIKSELIDLVVAALWGVVSINNQEKTDGKCE